MMRRNAARTVALALTLTVGLSYAVFAAVRTFSRRGAAPPLTVTGRVGVPLVPGASQPVDPRLTNRYDFRVALTRFVVSVSLDAKHRSAGCSSADFRVIQMGHGAYPVLMRAHSIATLSQLGAARLPQLAMVDRDVDQEACRGTTLTLRFRVSARKLTARERRVVFRG